MEGPGMHIPVKIGKVWVIGHRLKPSPPAEAGTNALRQSGLPCADIACHQNQMLRHCDGYFIMSDFKIGGMSSKITKPTMLRVRRTQVHVYASFIKVLHCIYASRRLFDV